MTFNENKNVESNRHPDGKLRIIVFGLNQDEVSGRLFSINEDVISVSGVVASSPGAELIEVNITAMNSPSGLKINRED